MPKMFLVTHFKEVTRANEQRSGFFLHMRNYGEPALVSQFDLSCSRLLLVICLSFLLVQ